RRGLLRRLREARRDDHPGPGREALLQRHLCPLRLPGFGALMSTEYRALFESSLKGRRGATFAGSAWDRPPTQAALGEAMRAYNEHVAPTLAGAYGAPPYVERGRILRVTDGAIVAEVALDVPRCPAARIGVSGRNLPGDVKPRTARP